MRRVYETIHYLILCDHTFIRCLRYFGAEQSRKKKVGLTMKKRYVKILTCFAIVLTVVLLAVGVRFVNEIANPNYKYIVEKYSGIGTLIIDDIVYREIIPNDFELIKKELEPNNEQLINEFIVKIDFPVGDTIWKYNIYGNEDKETRILLRGEDSSFFDSNRPDIYYCRLDFYIHL